ncbi:MAG TPA: hypothetical protein VFK36_13470 [Gemmatimonadales bacterium]|nr:hypothetical protein [Gemmatimonadales bacterium]
MAARRTSGSRGQGAVRCFISTALLVSCITPALQAQASGRWAMLLSGGARGMSRAELRLKSPASTLWLETDTAPAPLRDVKLEQGTVQFTLPGSTPMVFTGLVQGNVLRGTARADTGAPRVWTATRLQDITEYYPTLPRFTLRQIISGRRDTLSRIPGMWLAAARQDNLDFRARYETLARGAGIRALRGDDLEHTGPQRALGLADREEMVNASRATLEKIRAQIPSGTTRTAFDRIFRPRGTWLVDVHDAALAFAQAASPHTTFADARIALTAVGWLSPDSGATDAQVMAALYRLHGLMDTDSALVNSLLDGMQRADPLHASPAIFLFRAYDAADQWHSVALRFLLAARWIRSDDGATSIADMMRASWGDSLPMPVIQSRYFGSPQAVPRYGVPAPLFGRLVHADNWSAARWLERHHEAGLLDALRLLPAGIARDAELESPAETFRLTTVRREAESRDNGFLEPHDAIAVDAGYMPLLALAAALHEWEHLAFEYHRRLRDARDTSVVVTLRGADPYVAEGVAEWRTDQLLSPLAGRFPLLLAGEAEKRTRLAADATEPHALGYLLVRALAAVVPDPAARLQLLLAAADEPAGVTSRQAVAAAWSRYRSSADLIYGGAGRRALIPETTFTIEDGFPDPVAVRVMTGGQTDRRTVTELARRSFQAPVRAACGRPIATRSRPQIAAACGRPIATRSSTLNS